MHLGTPATVEALDTQAAPISVRRRLRWFFPTLSGALLAMLLVGFAPSFFLRGMLAVPFQLLPIPTYLVVHGVVLTTWFALVFAQTCLVAAHRTDLHRRLGVVAVGVAVMVVPISALVVVRAVPRLQAVGFTRSALYGVILGDFVSLLLFSVLVAAAIYFRRRPAIHKRLMIVSCFMIYGPVLSRLGSFYGLHFPSGWGVPPGSEVLAFLFVAVTALAIYDVMVFKRLHPATLWGAIGGEVIFVGLMQLLIRSGAADAVIDALG